MDYYDQLASVLWDLLETACSLYRYQIVLIIYRTIKNVDLTVV